MRDWPADDGEMLGPRASWHRTAKLPCEVTVAVSYPIAIAMLGPTRSLPLERLPVLITGIPVADLGGVCDPGKCVLVRWCIAVNVLANSVRKGLNLGRRQAVLKSEDWPINSGGSSGLSQFTEVLRQSVVPVREVNQPPPPPNSGIVNNNEDNEE